MRLNLRRQRCIRGFSCKDMARLFNISTSYYYKIESGSRNAKYDLAVDLAEFFSCNTLQEMDKLFYVYDNYEQFQEQLMAED